MTLDQTRAWLQHYSRRAPAQGDWTVLLDDCACKRITCCTLCGRPSPQVSGDAWHNGTVTAAVLLCRDCQRLDPRGEAVGAKLTARYR